MENPLVCYDISLLLTESQEESLVQNIPDVESDINSSTGALLAARPKDQSSFQVDVRFESTTDLSEIYSSRKDAEDAPCYLQLTAEGRDARFTIFSVDWTRSIS